MENTSNISVFKKALAVCMVIVLLFVSAPLNGFADIDWPGFKVAATDEGDTADRTVTESGECGDNVTYVLYDDGELVISGEGSMWDYSRYYYDDYSPFYSNRDEILNVVIEDGVTNIGKCVFYYCYSIKSIAIPDCVTSVGYEAFYNCSALTDIYYSGTKEQWFGVSMDDENSYLAEAKLHFANGDTVIGFGNCGDNVTYVLYDDGELVISGEGDMYDYSGDYFAYNFSPFYGNTQIIGVVIEDGVTSIGEYVFFDCTNLASVTIPDSVTSSGDSAFYYCSNITSVYITDLAAWCSISFAYMDSNPLCYGADLYLGG